MTGQHPDRSGTHIDATGEAHAAAEAHTAAEFWEARYAGSTRTWSGSPNPALTHAVAQVPPGRALDIGCGEGADAIWLAERGWSVDGIDLSATAIRRARSAADSAGQTGARFHAAGLLDWAPGREGSHDLVTALFLHTNEGQDRAALLRTAAGLVSNGGRLLVVSHGGIPPWAHGHTEVPAPITPESDRELVDPEHVWAVELAEIRTRIAAEPHSGRLEDSILLLRRCEA